MKPLRLLLLLISFAAATVALILLRSLTFETLLPDWLLAAAPSLAILNRWLPADVRTVALAAAVLSALCFGLAVPAGYAPTAPPPRAGSQALPATPFALFLALSAAVALFLWAGVRWLALDGWLLFLLWLVWMALLLALAALPDRGRRTRATSTEAAPERSWPWLIPLLLIAGFLFLRQSGSLPAALPAFSYAVGLQAQEQLSAFGAGPFAPGSASVPTLASALTALAQTLFANPFTALAIAGTVVGVALVAALWLLGCELFRRPVRLEGGELARDDGRTPALLAALALAGSLPMIQSARMPWLLEPVLWGTLGLWATLRALRTGSVRLIVAAGAALGLAAIWSPAGWLFAAVAALYLAAVALLRPRWLAADSGGLGLRGLLIGGAALAVTLAPAPCLGGCSANSQGASLLAGLDPALSLLGLSLDLTPTSPYALVLGLLPAALLLPALGALLLRPVHPASWLLLPWLALGAFIAARHAQTELGWPALAALLPAVALAIAVALDRSRAALVLSLGAWSVRAANTLAVGLLLVAALIAAQHYPRATGVANDATAAATAAARAIAALPEATPVTLLDDGAGLSWELPALRFALAGSHRSTGYLLVSGIADWPFQPGEVVLAPPRLRDALPALLARAPAAQVVVERDPVANPTLYRVQMP